MEVFLGILGAILACFLLEKSFRLWFFAGHPEIKRDFEEFERETN